MTSGVCSLLASQISFPLGISVTLLGVGGEIILVFGERRNGVWDPPEINLVTAGGKIHSCSELLVPTSFSPYLYSPTWSHLQLISTKHRLLTRNSCFEIGILKSDLTSQLWL